MKIQYSEFGSLVNTLQNIPSPTLAGMLPMIQSWVDAGMTQLYNLSDLVYVLNETPDASKNAYFKTYIPAWMASGLKDSWFISQCIRSLNSRPDTIALIAPNIPLWVSLEKQHEEHGYLLRRILFRLYLMMPLN